MEFLAKKLLEHFMVSGGSVITQRASIESFMNSQGLFSVPRGGGKTMDTKALQLILFFCEKLQNEGVLLYFGNQTSKPFLGLNYVCITYDQEIAEYGGYEFLVQGFTHIRKIFSNSVLPVEIENSNNEPDIGTSFVIGPNLLVTAKHCVENHHQIKISGNDETFIIPKVIGAFMDDNVDICIIKTEGEPFKGFRYFDLGIPETLMEILTMGYPPIPGFDAIQIADISNVGSALKNSKGNIIGNGQSYLDGLDYFLINAKVKSGNSGSPVVDKYGRVVGIVINIPINPMDKEKLDGLGYGIAVSGEMISILQHKIEYDKEFRVIPFNKLDKEGFSTIV